MKTLFFIFFSLFFSVIESSSNFSIVASPDQIGTKGLLFRAYVTIPSVTENTIFKLALSSNFVLFDSSSFFCTFEKGIKINTFPTCSQVSDTRTLVIVATPNNADQEQIVFSFGIYNHTGTSNQTDNFQLYFNLKEEQVLFTAQVRLQPKILRNLSLTLSNYISYEESSLKFKFMCPNQLNSGSKINVYFPPINPYAPSSSIRYPLPQEIKGSFIEGMTSSPTFSSHENLLQVVLSENIAENITLSFQIYNFLNPNSVRGHYNIDFYILDKTLGYLFEKKNCSFQIYLPNKPKFVIMTSLDKVVNKITDLNFTIFPLSFLNPNSSLILKFPDQFQFDSNTINNLSFVSIKNCDGNFKISMASNIFTISFLNSLYIEKDSIAFSLRNIINPRSSFETSSFQITILDSDGSLIERQFDNLAYLPIPGSISAITTEFANNQIGALTNVTISFKKQSPLNELGVIQIDFPSEFILSLVNELIPIRGIPIYFQYKIVNQSVIISNIFVQGFSRMDSDSISFRLLNIMNPQTTKLLHPMKFLTRIDDNIVDQALFEILNLGSASIFIEGILPYSKKSMQITTYLISFRASININKGAFIQIEFPQEFVPQFSNTQSPCQLIVEPFSFSSTCFYKKYSIYLNISISNDTLQIKNNELISLQIENIRNPHGLSQTSTFKISLHDQSNTLLAQNTNEYAIQMNQRADVMNVSFYTRTTSVGDSATYFLDFTLLDIINKLDSIIIQLPPTIKSKDVAISISSDKFLPLSFYTLENNKFLIISADYVEYNTPIVFAMNSFRNPLSVINVFPIKISFIDNKTNTTYASYTDLNGFNGYTPLNQTPVLITFDNHYIGKPNTLNISFNLSLPISKNGKILVGISTNLDQKSQLQCISSIEMTCSSPEPNLIQIQNFLEDLQINSIFKVLIKGFSNPQLSIPSSQFTFKSYDSTGNIIEVGVNTLPEPFLCNENCLKCSNLYTNCSECELNYFLIGTSCVKSCPSSYFPKNFECHQCLTPNQCASCDPKDPKICIQCKTDQILYQGTCFPNTTNFQELFFSNNTFNSFNQTTFNSFNQTIETNKTNIDKTINNETFNKTIESNLTIQENSSIIIKNESNIQKSNAIVFAFPQEIILFNTEYDNKPYLSIYLILSLLFIACNKLLFRSKTISTISTLIFLWCFLDLICIILLILKLILIEKYLYLLCLIFIVIFQLALHLIVSYKLWKLLKTEAEYLMPLEKSCSFKLPHLITFGLNHRFSYLFFSGIGQYGNINFTHNTRPKIIRILTNSLIFNVVFSTALIVLLVNFIIFRAISNEEIPLFFYEYTVFLILYIIAQLFRICVKPKEIPHSFQKSNIEIQIPNSNDNIPMDKVSPPARDPKKSFVSNIIANLTSGKKQRFGVNVKEAINVKGESPLLLLNKNSLDINKGINDKDVSFEISPIPSIIQYNKGGKYLHVFNNDDTKRSLRVEDVNFDVDQSNINDVSNSININKNKRIYNEETAKEDSFDKIEDRNIKKSSESKSERKGDDLEFSNDNISVKTDQPKKIVENGKY